MPRSCWCRCWSAPRDAVKCSGRSRAFRRSSCYARSTQCSSSARCAPSWCSVVRCTCTRRGTRMTVGVPGTGIGGMFYVVSALALPLRQAYRSFRRRPSAGGWRVVAALTAMAGAILGAIWMTGWLIGIAIAASASVVRPPPLLGAHPGNVLRTAALVLSAATLAAVLLGVELLRLWVHREAGAGVGAGAAGAGTRTQIRRVAALVMLAAAGDGTFTVAAQD